MYNVVKIKEIANLEDDVVTREVPEISHLKAFWHSAGEKSYRAR